MAELTRIGLNAVFLQPRMGGIETYVRRLVPELVTLRPEVRFSVFANHDGARVLAAEPWAHDVELVTHRLLGRRYVRALSELTLLGLLADRRVELLHSVAMTGPLRMRGAHVVTIGDLTWLHDPDTVGRSTARLWGALVPPVARRAQRLLTYSEATRTDVHQQLGIPLARIDAVPLGPGAENRVLPTPEGELRERIGLGAGRVVLTVSAKRPHKNLRRLVQAFRRVRARVPDAVLVMPGNPTEHEQELRRESDALGLSDAVRFPAYVGAADLEGLFRLAECFVFPSLREGFGLPILEAMRRGVPSPAPTPPRCRRWPATPRATSIRRVSRRWPLRSQSCSKTVGSQRGLARPERAARSSSRGAGPPSGRSSPTNARGLRQLGDDDVPPAQTVTLGPDPTDVLDTPAAGGHVIRGSVLRTGSYVAGMALGVLSAALMIRHLGVEDFGKYVVVTSLIGVVAGISEAGMSNIAVREYSTRSGLDRDRLMANLLGLRVAVTMVGMLGAALFAVLADTRRQWSSERCSQESPCC